jgi:small multidrug resistance pump
MQILVQAALLSAAIALEVLGTLALRASQGLSKPLWIVPVAVGYIGAFALLTLVLKAGMPVGVGYAIWAGVGVAATAVLAHYWFRDPLTWLMGAGTALIIGGVILVELGGQPTHD